MERKREQMTMVLDVRVAADPELPCRDLLLDDSAMRATLAALGDGTPAIVSACSVRRVNYQVGKSIRTVFRATIDDQERTIAARMFRHGRSAEAYERARSRAIGANGLRGVVHAAHLETVFWLFPNDRKIDVLPSIASPHARGTAGRGNRRWELAAYAPEKSATVAFLNRSGRAFMYAKVTAADQAARDYARYVHLRAVLPSTHPRLRVPAPLAYSTKYRALWLEAIDGRRFAEIDGTIAREDVERLGAAVASFHALSVPDAPRFDRFSESRLRAGAELLARMRPDVTRPADAFARHLAATLPRVECDACLHGDLHPKNAIATGDRIALIDLEDVALGPAAADIGSFIAGLVYLSVSRRISEAACAAQTSAFLAGYAAQRRLPCLRSIAWYAAAALFVERALRAVTRIRPLGLACLPDLLAESERLLDRGVALR
jgi:aminoglycoside phosphotransferase